LKAIVTLAQAIVKDYSVKSKALRRRLLPHIEACILVFKDGDETSFINGIFGKLDFRDSAEVVLRFSLVYFECGKIDMARRLQDRVVRLATMEGHSILDNSEEVLLWARAMLATSLHDLNGPGQRQEAMELREMVLQDREDNFKQIPALERNSIDGRELYEAYLIALSNLADSCDEVPSQIGYAIEYRKAIYEGRKNSPMTPDFSETQLRLARSYFQGGLKDKSFEIRYAVTKRRVNGPPENLDELDLENLDELDLQALSDLAESYCDRGEWNRASGMRKKVWEGRKVLLGPDHHDTLAAKASGSWGK
jgi:tetratricopeptide (TPR) repeat protein